MNIKDGGAISNLTKTNKMVIEEIRVYHESGRSIYLTINDDCLSYLTIEEALTLRDELNKAIKEAVNL